MQGSVNIVDTFKYDFHTVSIRVNILEYNSFIMLYTLSILQIHFLCMVYAKKLL